jgi:hypothetical protein
MTLSDSVIYYTSLADLVLHDENEQTCNMNMILHMNELRSE